jgi:hypothetical protein
MKFDALVESFFSKKPVEKLGNQEAADRIVDVLNETHTDEVAGAVIEALNRYYTLDSEQAQALASFFDQHLSD